MRGGELSKEDAAEPFGKEGKELLSGFANATGMDMSSMTSADKDRLKSVLDKAASGGDIDKELTGVEAEMRKGLMEGKRKGQDAAAAADDPSYRKLESVDKHMAEMVRVSKITAMHAGVTADSLKNNGKEEATPT